MLKSSYEIKEVPKRDKWLSEEAINVIDNFNVKGEKLKLIPFDTDMEIEDIFEEGLYEFEYPEGPEASELEKMMEELANGARYITLLIEDLVI